MMQNKSRHRSFEISIFHPVQIEYMHVFSYSVENIFFLIMKLLKRKLKGNSELQVLTANNCRLSFSVYLKLD